MGAMRIDWAADGATLFGTATSNRRQVLWYLIVEQLLGTAGWDWTIWHNDDRATVICHGVSTSRASAKASAEQSAQSRYGETQRPPCAVAADGEGFASAPHEGQKAEGNRKTRRI